MNDRADIPKNTVFSIMILIIGTLGFLGVLWSLLMIVGIVRYPQTNPAGITLHQLIATNIFSALSSGSLIVCGVALLKRKLWGATFLIYSILAQTTVSIINIVYTGFSHGPVKALMVSFVFSVLINGLICWYLWIRVLNGKIENIASESPAVATKES